MEVKKTRALPHVWASFFSLKRNDEFFIGKKLYGKTSPFTGKRKSAIGYDGVFVWPWSRVRTNVLVRDAYIGGKGERLNLPEFAKDLPTKPVGFDQPRVDSVPLRADGFPEGFTRGGHDLTSPEEFAAYNERTDPSC